MEKTKVMRIDFTQHIGPYEQPMVALFESRDMTEAEAKQQILLYPQGYDKKIVFMSLQQFETVFRSLKEGL